MQFEKLYDSVCNNGENNYFIEMVNRLVRCEVRSACFSALHNWEELYGWDHEGYIKEKHAPKYIHYMINHYGLSRDEFLFWTKTILEHPAMVYQASESYKFKGGYVKLSGNLEHNFLLHELGMLRAMREYPKICKAAYALFKIAKTGNTEQDHKIARLVMYLGSQFNLYDGDAITHNSRNGDGGHDPAGTRISQLDLAHYVNGGEDLGGDSLTKRPSYDNITNGLFYHDVPSYGLRDKTLGQLARQWATFFTKHGSNIKTINVEEFKKLVNAQIGGLDLLLDKSKKLIKAKADEKLKKDNVKRAKEDKGKAKRVLLAERKMSKQDKADKGIPF